MNVNNPYNNNYQNPQATDNTQQTQPQAQTQPAYGGFAYYQPAPQVQGINQGQPNLFPENNGYAGGSPQQTQPQIQPQSTPSSLSTPIGTNYNNSPYNAPMTRDVALEASKIALQHNLNGRNDIQATQRYMAVAQNTIGQLKRESLDYKALWMEANTANIQLRRENEYLHEQVQMNNSVKVQQLEIDQNRVRQDYAVNQSRTELLNMLEDDWQEHLKNGKQL